MKMMDLREQSGRVLRVAILADNRDEYIRTSDLLRQIEGEQFEIRRLDTPADATRQPGYDDWDLIIVDSCSGPASGVGFIRGLRNCGCESPLILLTEAGDDDTRLEALEAGAAHLLSRDKLTLNNLRRSISYAIEGIRKTRLLRENERRLKMALQGSRASVWEIDLDSWAVTIDEVLLRRLGLDPERVPLSMDQFQEVVHPDDWNGILDSVRALLDGHEDETRGEWRTRDSAGELVWFYTRGHVVGRDAGGRPLKLMGIAIDISDRKQAEDALRRSEERYRAIFETIQDVYYEVDLEGTITEVSPSIERISLYSRHELVGKKLSTIYRDLQDRTPLLEELMAHGRVNDYELILLDKGGDERHCSVTAELQLDDTGNPRRIVGSLRDISDRLKTEAELKQSKERFENLYNNAQVGLFRTRISDGQILACNELAAEIFGYDDPAQMVREYATSEHYVDRDERDRMLRELNTRGFVHNWESEFVRKDGSTFWARHSSRIFPDLGAIEGAVTDCTEQIRAEQALRDSEEKYRLLTENLRDVVLRVSLMGKLEYCSPAIKEFGGYDPVAEQGEPIVKYFARRRDYVKAIRMMQRAAMHRRSSSMEFLYKPKDRDPFWVEVSGQPVIRDGKVVAIQSVMRDISERRRAEEAVRESAARFRELADLLPEGVYEATPDGRLTFANRLAHEYFGYPEDAAASGLNIALMIAPNDRQRALDNVTRILAGEQLGTAEYTGLRYDGSTFPIAIHSSRMMQGGRPVGIRGVVVDITERRCKEEELRRLSKAVNQSGNLICITDLDGAIEYVNTAFTEVTGYSVEEVMGRGYGELRSGKHDSDFYDKMWHTIRSGQTYSGMFRNRRRNGELYWERKTISPIFDETGEITHYLSVGTDVTNEIIAQEKLSEADKLSAIGMLAAGVAHEFKNYLGGIIGNASLALEQLQEDEGAIDVREVFDQIIHMGERANDVAMSLLTYSKSQPDEVAPVDLSELVKDAISLIGKELRNLFIEVVTYFEEIPHIYGSASKLQQMLLNLLINAQHAIGKNGVISVSVFNLESTIEIRVADTGRGIPEENLKRIFDPFFSTKGAWGRDEVVGTGMGLSICRNTAREHGGEITVVSSQGIGSTFTITLPVRHNSRPSLEDPERPPRTISMMIFTLNKSLVSHYYRDAAARRVDLSAADSCDLVMENLQEIDGAVVCDAHFSGKIELLKVAEACQATGVPYVMINCDRVEYQLAEVFGKSSGNFAGLPEMHQILDAIATGKGVCGHEKPPPGIMAEE